MQKKLKTYYTKTKGLSLLSSTISLLYLDQETSLPAQAAQFRGEQIGLMSSLVHKKFIDKKFGKLITDLYEQKDALSPQDQRDLFLAKKSYDQEVKVPISFVEEFETAKSISQMARLKAKKEHDFKTFRPHLEKMFEMTKRYTAYIEPQKAPYDVMLDLREEGMTTETLETLFSNIKIPLKTLIKKCKSDASHLVLPPFEKHRVEAFIKSLLTQIGFDFQRGALGEVHHPFEITMSINDVRLNTNYNNLMSTLTSSIHELGHGLYEQNINPRYEYTHLNHGVSLGVHESQSRFLENVIGKSRAFLSFCLPLIKKHFVECQHLHIDDLYNSLNLVKPSLIRTEADELTYNMHIILRFEIEKGILDGKYQVKDLPEIWNEKMQEYLGIVPSHVAEGCLQDVHRSEGLIAYFPTYTLGNVLSGQLLTSFKKEHPTYEKEIEKGNFTPYFDRFKTHIWQHGSLYPPKELVKLATGESLNARYFLEYLEKKYVKDS